MEIVGVIVLVAWSLTFVGTLINLAVLRRLPVSDATTGSRVSIIVPARNEEASIERSVRTFLSQTYADLEVIVVNDRSVDRTGPILDGIAAGDARLRVVQGVEPSAGWLGKPWALQQGYENSSGDLLLFVDADICYAAEAVASMVARLRRSGAGMLSVLPHFEMRGFWENALMPQLAMTVLSFLPAWISNRSRRPWLGIGGGPGNLVRRDAYREAGTHVALQGAVVDDVGLARMMRRAGFRTEIARADHLVSLRMYRGLTEIIEGFTKNGFAAFGRSYVAILTSVILTPVFHVLPYARALTGDPVAIATVVLISLTRLVLFASLRYRLDSALLLHPVMTAVWAWIFLRSAWITGIRGQLHWRGRKYDATGTRFGGDR